MKSIEKFWILMFFWVSALQKSKYGPVAIERMINVERKISNISLA